MRSYISIFTLAACVTCTGVALAQQPDVATTTALPATAQPPLVTTTPPTTAIVTTQQQTMVDLPAQETTRSPVNRPLLITGLVVFGGTYGASVIDAATSTRDADKNYLIYPVVGPWMDYAHRDCDLRPCPNETGNKALLILDGVGQGLGALSVVASLFIPEKTTRNWYLIGGRGVHAAPSRVGTGYGFGAGGVF